MNPSGMTILDCVMMKSDKAELTALNLNDDSVIVKHPVIYFDQQHLSDFQLNFWLSI